jgi:hypothetical protein
VGAIFFENIEKSGMRIITGDTQESGSNPLCEFQRDIKKFLVAFSNENLFVDAAAKGHFSGHVSYPKISAHPQLRFLRRPSISKN